MFQSNDALLKSYVHILDSIAQEVETIVLIEGQMLRDEAGDLTPVDEGALRASRETTLLRDDGKIMCDVTFTQKYAVYVHENAKAKHTVGQSHFLSTPFHKMQDGFMKRVQRALGVVLKRKL